MFPSRQKAQWLLWVVALLVLRCTLAVHGQGSDSASGGWAETEITPPLGIALGGRGGAETAANKVLDPLYAQVLYLKDSRGVGFVLVSFDLIGLPHDLSDRIRTDIVNELGVPWNLVVLNASHTHSGPHMLRSLMAGVGPVPQIETDYFNSLEAKTLLIVRAAARGLKPVKVEVFEGKSNFAINRRGKNAQGKRGILPDPTGAFDDRVWVLKVSPSTGGEPAVVFSYACHPVLVYGYDYAAISADFPGATRRALRQELGVSAHVQFVQGFAGNVRPRVVADLEHHRFRKPTPSDLSQAGKELSTAVMTAMKGTAKGLRLRIAGTGDRPFLPRSIPPPRSVYETMQREATASTNRYLLGVSQYWLERYDAKVGFAKGDAWSLGLIRLADNQWIVHSAGEPCVEWRTKIETWLRPLDMVTWGYCQEAKSYLPTESMLPEGGYEVLDSNRARASTPAPYAIGIEHVMRDSLLRQLSFLQKETDSPQK